MNVFCRQLLPLLQGTMQAISRLLLVSLLGLFRIISLNQTFNRLCCRKRRKRRGGVKTPEAFGGYHVSKLLHELTLQVVFTDGERSMQPRALTPVPANPSLDHKTFSNFSYEANIPPFVISPCFPP